MPRILGVDIPDDKKVEFSLRYLYGIGPTRATQIVQEAGISPDLRARELSEEQLGALVAIINSKGYKLEGDLRRDIIANKKRLQSIKSYRGLRHFKGLPVRGQRTKTNARTCKGRRRSAGSMPRGGASKPAK